MEKQFTQLQKIKEKLTDIHEKMEERFDDHSDAWYEGEKAEECEDKMNSLQECIDNLEYAIDALETII